MKKMWIAFRCKTRENGENEMAVDNRKWDTARSQKTKYRLKENEGTNPIVYGLET